jgi:hypothetical protein
MVMLPFLYNGSWVASGCTIHYQENDDFFVAARDQNCGHSVDITMDIKRRQQGCTSDHS